MWKKFNPCSPCCGMPIVVISTFDSSVSYTHLCFFENNDGTPGASCFSYPPADRYDPDGSCVHAPKQWDKDKWNLDVDNFTQTRLANEAEWPIAGGIITGKYRCWAGVKESITAITEPWVEDTYGDFEFMASGTGTNSRITLQDLKDMFESLYDKHGFVDKLGKFSFLFLVDNTGSILISEWPLQVKTDFEAWVETEYPNCQKRIVELSDYFADGEDWVRHCDVYYQETIEGL